MVDRNNAGNNNWVPGRYLIGSEQCGIHARAPYALRDHRASRKDLYHLGQFGHFGGSRNGQDSRVDIYDLETGTWRHGPDLSAKHCQSERNTLISDKRIIVVGEDHGRQGFAGSTILAIEQNAWKTVGQLPEPLLAPAAGIINGNLYVAGGSFDGDQPLPKMWSRDAS